MIISPPLLRAHNDSESDGDWVKKMIPIDEKRGFPINSSQAWHGGVHLCHSDNTVKPEMLRSIADGTVIFIREASLDKRDKLPLNRHGSTDLGCIVIRHETEIGRGDEGKIVFYSLYQHLKSINEHVKLNEAIKRKAPLGTVGMVDGENAIHFQICCDDDNIKKITGRDTAELDITKDGRTDIIYGDMHFYLPIGTVFYEDVPETNIATNTKTIVHTSVEPLFVTMRFEKGNCSMITRNKSEVTATDSTCHYEYKIVGDELINTDGDFYEYNLYAYARKLYSSSRSAVMNYYGLGA